jgi:putative DNA primase/helicase
MWTGEDSIADTLVPRLSANGAEMERVRFVRTTTDGSGKRPFDPATNTPALVLALSRLAPPPALLIVDHRLGRRRRLAQELRDSLVHFNPLLI